MKDLSSFGVEGESDPAFHRAAAAAEADGSPPALLVRPPGWSSSSLREMAAAGLERVYVRSGVPRDVRPSDLTAPGVLRNGAPSGVFAERDIMSEWESRGVTRNLAATGVLREPGSTGVLRDTPPSPDVLRDVAGPEEPPPLVAAADDFLQQMSVDSGVEEGSSSRENSFTASPERDAHPPADWQRPVGLDPLLPDVQVKVRSQSQDTSCCFTHCAANRKILHGV